jgi:hypothetical protein
VIHVHDINCLGQSANEFSTERKCMKRIELS